MKHLLIPITVIVLILLVISIFLFTRDYDCKNFDSRDQAMETLKKHKTDIYHLDGDYDGIPCESLI